jgi:4-amino-4-deoxy-L-arabinose transferase-like glycosyltransferase
MSDTSLLRACFGGAVVVALFSCALIIGTYSRLSHTWDEPTHVVAGLEWLETGRYTFQTENPPLSRIPLAVIPYLDGARMPTTGRNGATPPAASIYYRTQNYSLNVTEARVVNVFFFLVVLILTWTLSGGRSDPVVAFLATAIVATLPPLVAHSGFATTDIPFVAAFLLALLSWRLLLEHPTVLNGIWFGCALGISVATKFSTFPFFPPVALAVAAMLWWSGRLPSTWFSFRRVMQLGGSAFLVAAFVIWASYGFGVGRLADLPRAFGPYGQRPTTGIVARIQDWKLPGHEFIHGLLYLKAHTELGHPSFMLGENSERGFWLFYPVGLFFKTPILTLVFFVSGFVLLFTRKGDRFPQHAGYALGALGLLAVAATSPINNGLRHVFVVYPLIAMASAYGLVRAFENIGRGWRGVALAVLLPVSQAVLVGASFPNQIAYFNIMAGSDPGFVLSDSDLDWGQDVLAMERYFTAHPVPELYVLPNGTALFCEHNLPPLKSLPVGQQVNGWIAVFERPYRLNRGRARKDICSEPGAANSVKAPSGWLDWLHSRQPVARIGSSVLLFHITDAEEHLTGQSEPRRFGVSE